MIDCHIHMVMDGIHLGKAIKTHKNHVVEGLVFERLSQYHSLGYTHLRDGGDHVGVGTFAQKIAPQFGIAYATPGFAICKTGHYGGFLARTFEDFTQYLQLLQEIRQNGGGFAKLMVSGLMDFSQVGKLSQPSLKSREIGDMIGAAHDLGLAVMVHANGSDAVSAAVSAGAESVEHGGYMDSECLCQLAESNTVWVPTLSPLANLIGKGRFDDKVLKCILNMQIERVQEGAKRGAKIALGSDAGAGFVPHGQGGLDEKKHLQQALGVDCEAVINRGNQAILQAFFQPRG